MPSEFELIARYFERKAKSAVLGVGDDAALVRASADCDLAISTDMLLEGRHFLPGAEPRALGHKTLAVNLSDMAAMGAKPRWATLAMALPSDDEAWLEAFAQGLFALAERHGVELIGGDTTRGPLTLALTILGEVPRGKALLRSGARVGDDVWVSGELGGGALGLAYLQGEAHLSSGDARDACVRLEEPEARVALGERLIGIAHSAIDVSDGFAADLGHILERSGLGATVNYDALPRPAAFARLKNRHLEQRCVLSGGDDYELVFTAAPAARASLATLGGELGLRLSRVGTIEAGSTTLRVLDHEGKPIAYAGGFDHFRRDP
jgi:thiamine-monophosphate kinase